MEGEALMPAGAKAVTGRCGWRSRPAPTRPLRRPPPALNSIDKVDEFLMPMATA